MQESGYPRRRHRLVWEVALTVVAVDALSKAWAFWALSESPRRLPGISLQLALQTDAAWLGARGAPLLAIFDALLVGMLAVLAREITTNRWAVAAGLAAGGAAGDFIDRLARPPGFLRGAVVHWIEIASMASFNLADIALGLAAVLAAAMRRAHGYG
jgi:signal peptidase II